MNEKEKFIVRISCDPKIEPLEDGSTKIVDKMLTLRVEKVNESVISQLRDLMKEKGINELYAIDESKVLELVKKAQTLEIIEENLKYGYVFIGYDKDHKPLFQFVDTKLYEEIKKNMNIERGVIMNKGLDLIKRQQPEIINGFPTGNIFIGVTKEELTELEKELKKGIAVRKFLVAITREYTEKDFEDFTVDDLNDAMKENGISITFTQEEYDLIKEEILCH